MIVTFIGIAFVFSLLVFLVKNRGFSLLLTFIFLLSLSALSIYSVYKIGITDSLFYKFDSLGALFSLILSILNFATFYHSILYFQRHDFSKKQEAAYYAALIMLNASMISAYYAENIALLWVSIEATTLFVSVLIFHERTKDALEATWKYLFISSVGVAIAFMGILFFSLLSTQSGFSELSISKLMESAAKMDTLWLKIAFLLVLTGFSAKMGIFPLHTVTVDAHTVAPPPISAFISTTLMNVGFLGIFRVFCIIDKTPVLQWAQNVLMIIAVISIFMAAIQLLKVKHFKRMFAFSSLENMGIVTLGLAAGGLGYYAAILHIVLHSFIKSSLFYQIGQVHSIYNSYYVSNTGNYFKKYSIGGLAVILCLLSITAIPPSGLFISELLVFKALFLSNQIAVGIAVLILLTIIIYVFIKNFLHLLYSQEHKSNELNNQKINIYETISQFLLLGFSVYLGIGAPDFLVWLINNSVSILK